MIIIGLNFWIDGGKVGGFDRAVLVAVATLEMRFNVDHDDYLIDGGGDIVLEFQI